MLLVGFEPEDESPIVFLRLRKAAARRGTKVVSVAPFTSPRPATRCTARWSAPRPATRPRRSRRSPTTATVALDAGGVILVGERLADRARCAVRGARRWPATTGAKLAWVPRRAGERGALEAGCLPNLLPGGRPVADAAARVDLGTVWGATVPARRRAVTATRSSPPRPPAS